MGEIGNWELGIGGLRIIQTYKFLLVAFATWRWGNLEFRSFFEVFSQSPKLRTSQQRKQREGFATGSNVSRSSTITCTLVGTIAIVHKSQLFTTVTIDTNTNRRDLPLSTIGICDLWSMLAMKICEQYLVECSSNFLVMTNSESN